MADAAEQILAALLAERGGPAAFDVASLGVARALSSILASDAPSPKAIEVLSSLLPAKQTSGAQTYDLSRLSHRQFELLSWLMAIAAGEPVGKPARTRSELNARCLGLKLAKLELSGCRSLTSPAGSGRRATADEVIEIRSELDAMLWHCGLDASELWPSAARLVMRPSEVAVPEVSSGEAPTSDAPTAIAAPSSVPAEVPTPNVQPLFGAFSAPSNSRRFDHPTTRT